MRDLGLINEYRKMLSTVFSRPVFCCLFVLVAFSFVAFSQGMTPRVKYHPNGKISWEIKRAGENTFVERRYSSDGKVTLEGYYKGNKKEGLWTSYQYRTGARVKAVVTSYKNGKRSGLLKTFFKSGTVKSEIAYLDDERSGPARFYYEGGAFKLVGSHVNGLKHGQWKRFWGNGNVWEEENYAGGKRHGVFRTFYKNGQLKTWVSAIDGKWQGPEEWFDKDGDLIRETSYKDGKRDGKVTGWKKGVLAHVGMYRNDRKAGIWKYYYRGKLAEIGTYRNGRKEGIWKYYRNGKLARSVLYENGNRVRQ